MSSNYLFVYGTLREGSINSMHHLMAGAKHLNHAYIEGSLYEIDGYPGYVPSHGTETIDEQRDARSNKVHGELYYLKHPKIILERLDDYEECSMKFPKPHEFARVLQPIFISKQEQLLAWVYQYTRPTHRLKQIKSGDYLNRMR